MKSLGIIVRVFGPTNSPTASDRDQKRPSLTLASLSLPLPAKRTHSFLLPPHPVSCLPIFSSLASSLLLLLCPGMYSVSSFTFPSPSWLDQLLLPSKPHYDAFLSAVFSSAQSLVHTDNITSTNIDGAFWAGVAASPATLFLLILYMLLHALSLYPPNIAFFFFSCLRDSPHY